MAGRTYRLSREKFHNVWDNSLEPALEIAPGDTVVFDLQDVSGGTILPSSKAEDLQKRDPNKMYPLGGPIYVRDAKPGDLLEVKILTLTPGDWGWSGFVPERGLLPEEFPYYYIKHYDLSNHKTTKFKPGLVLPLDPFCGTMGVAPKDPGPHSTRPPDVFGGNMDIRHLTAGSTLFLPVQVEGALFSCGDCHSAQGDGEVCLTGIESPMLVKLRFKLRKGRSIPLPQFSTTGPLTRKYDSKGYYATTGINPDLLNSAKMAVHNMIEYLTLNRGLTRDEAYILCSVAADLKISELVDKPNYLVSCYLPLNIFHH